MRGHQPLIAMRRRGIRPASVWLSVDMPDPMTADWQQWAKSAAVDIDPTDSIGLLDLRFTVGMLVCIQGLNRERCMALHERCREAKAARVMTHVARSTGQEHRPFETVLQALDERIVYEVTQ
jgi:hypothetical protein